MKNSIPFLFRGIIGLALSLVMLHVQSAPPDEASLKLGVRLDLGEDAVELIVPKADAAGVVELYGSSDLGGLDTLPENIRFTNAPTGGDLLWRVPVEEQAFYRALLRAGKTLEDYYIPDWDEPVDPTNRVALVVAGVPGVMVSGSSFTATLILTGSDGQIVPLAATGLLRILSWQNGGLHPDATVKPSDVRFTNGIAVVRTTIQALTSLDGFTLGIEWADAAPSWPGPGSRRAGPPAKRSILQLPAAALGCFGDPDPEGDLILIRARLRDCILSFRDHNTAWGNPLPQAPFGGAKANGSFGEWRGHKRRNVPNNNVHVGLDLKADAGKEVVASRGGWLTVHDGLADGRYVTINHLDGTCSRYLHLQPWAAGDAIPGRVGRGDRLGSVGNPGGGPHLHFEIRRTPDIFSSARQPGQGVDPVREAGLFPVGGLDSPTILESFQVAGEHPAKEFVPYAGATEGLPAAGGQAYVIIQVRQQRFDGKGAGLSPREVQMRWEGGGGPVAVDLADEEAVRKAKPANSQGGLAGFAIYEHGKADTSVSGKLYRYWFGWDASRYASEPNGARTLTLVSKSYAPEGVTSEWQVKWGPEIEIVEPMGEVGADGRREYRLRVRYWRGHRVGGAAEPVLKGHDWYEYELSEGGVWVASEGIQGGGAKTKDPSGTVATRELRFRMPAGKEALGWVKVSSGRVPPIAHRKELDAGCDSQELNLLITTGGPFTALGLDVGINAKGVIAFTANDANGSAAFTVDEAGVVIRQTFQSSNRTFGTSVAINDAIPPEIAVRDRVGGSPPTFLMRRWVANGKNDFSVVGNSASGNYDSASFRADINKLGVVSFSALVAGSTATVLLAGDSQATLKTLATFSTATGLYPQISDDNVIVIRDTVNRIVTYKFPPNGADEVIAGNGYKDVGRAPGIAASSDVLAFSGNRSSGKGLFVALKGPTGRSIFRLAGEGVDLLTDVDLDSRVGVTATGKLTQGLELAAVFSGTFNGTKGVYAIGAKAIETNGNITLSAGPPVMIAPVGVSLNLKTGDGTTTPKTISQFVLYDPINARRQIAFGAQFTDGSAGIIRVDPCATHQIPAPAHRPFKQFHIDEYLVDDVKTSGLFKDTGYAITSFATAIDKVSHAAVLPIPNFDPRVLQQWLRSRNMQDTTNGRVALGAIR
jgi:murein DD-endopeptidase MepM/ murein hydrolase activator NlpD